VTVDAGAGDDTLTGSNGRDSLNGGNGDDMIDGRAGTDYLAGGPGADVLDGGNGPSDMVYYTARTEDLHISSDGVANDGAAGEGDNVEEILSGSGNDTIVEFSASGFVAGNGETTPSASRRALPAPCSEVPGTTPSTPEARSPGFRAGRETTRSRARTVSATSTRAARELTRSTLTRATRSRPTAST
jgi:hypothetical protein